MCLLALPHDSCTRHRHTPLLQAYLSCVRLQFSAHISILQHLYAIYFCCDCQVTAVFELAELHHVGSCRGCMISVILETGCIENCAITDLLLIFSYEQCAQHPAGSVTHDISGEATVHKLAGCTVQSSIFSWDHVFTHGKAFKQQQPTNDAG